MFRGLVAAIALLWSSCGPTPPVGAPSASAAASGPSAALSPAAAATASAPGSPGAGATPKMTEYPVGPGQGPHDVAPAPDGGVWYTAQRTGELGYLDPKTGATKMTKLGAGSAPHGVIVGPDGNPWVTDGGLNAIVRVDAKTNALTRYPLPGPNVNLNTAAFDHFGDLWFTGQSGYYGRLQVATGTVRVWNAPRGPGPYGISARPDGDVWYASLAGNHIADIDEKSGEVVTFDPPTRGQGARRVWSDSKGVLWISEWNVGQLARYDPTSKQWKEWKLPGANPMPYAVYVDDQDVVWLSDFGANAIVRFDPRTEQFLSLPHSAPNAAVRQLLGRPGEVWGAMSGQDKLVVVRTR